MQRPGCRLAVGGFVAGIAALLYASACWACIFLAGITVSATNVQPGGSLTVRGISFKSNPVDMHLDSPTGPVLATATPDSKGNFSQPVAIPPDLGTGPHVIVATQAAATVDGRNNGAAQGVPARAAFQVGTAPPPAPVSAGPVQVANSAGIGTLVLIGAVVACLGILLGGAISLVAARSRRPEARPVAG